MNARNYGVAMGRLTRDASILTNADGSRKVFVTVAVPCNYKGKDGNRKSDFISLEGYIPNTKSNNGVYDYMHKADMVSIGYTIKSQAYTSKAGKQEYRQYLSIETVELISTNRTNATTQQTVQQQSTAPAQADVVQDNTNFDPLANMREAVDVDYAETLNDINDFTELPW